MLPYGMRRWLLLKLRPNTARMLQQIRTSRSGLSLRPYLEKRVLFVHVPKTAGTSIRKALFPDVYPGHMSLHYMSLALTKQEFVGSFKFAFVRNPWDRLYSTWRFLRRGGKHPDDENFAARYLNGQGDFEEFVLKRLGNPEIDGHLHFKTQESFVSLGRGTILLDFIGYYESLEEDFMYVTERMGLADLKLPISNSGGEAAGAYRSVYTPTMIARVADYYRDDILRFGYAFDGFHPVRLNKKEG